MKIEFKQQLEELGFKTYRQYLKSEHWKDVKKRFYKSRLFKGGCFCCADRNSILHIHHRTYKRLGKEWLHDLIAVCEICHSNIHLLLETNSKVRLYNAHKKIRGKWNKEKKQIEEINLAKISKINKLQTANYVQEKSQLRKRQIVAVRL